MNQLEVFFDYACPFCLEGHQNLIRLLPDFPGVEIIWRPCEAHPRPERYGTHSDLCIQGMFFAEDAGIDLWAYHEWAYSLILKRRLDVEKIDTLAECFFDLSGADDLRAALVSGRYLRKQLAANDYAYEESDVWVVPAYRMNGKRLDSVENVGVSIARLRAFLQEASHAQGDL